MADGSGLLTRAQKWARGFESHRLRMYRFWNKIWKVVCKQLVLTVSGAFLFMYLGWVLMLLVQKASFRQCPHWPSGFDCMFYPSEWIILPIVGWFAGPFIMNLLYSLSERRKKGR